MQMAQGEPRIDKIADSFSTEAVDGMPHVPCAAIRDDLRIVRRDHADVTHSNNGRGGGRRGRLAERGAIVLVFPLVSVLNASLSTS